MTIGRGTWVTATSPRAATAGKWSHLVARIDERELSLWINGKENVRADAGGAFTPSAYGLVVGGSSFSRDRCLRGTVDELLIYDRRLSDEEALALFARGKARDSISPEGAELVSVPFPIEGTTLETVATLVSMLDIAMLGKRPVAISRVETADGRMLLVLAARDTGLFGLRARHEVWDVTNGEPRVVGPIGCSDGKIEATVLDPAGRLWLAGRFGEFGKPNDLRIVEWALPPQHGR